MVVNLNSPKLGHMHGPYGFCGCCFQGPLAPQKTANTAEGGIPGAEKRTQVSLAIDTLISQSIQQDEDLKGMAAGLEQVRQDELKILSGLEARVAGCIVLGSHIVT